MCRCGLIKQFGFAEIEREHFQILERNSGVSSERWQFGRSRCAVRSDLGIRMIGEVPVKSPPAAQAAAIIHNARDAK